MNISSNFDSIRTISKSVENLFSRGSQLIKVMVPREDKYHLELITNIYEDLNQYNVLIASDLLYELLSHDYNVISIDELFEKKITINGNIKVNKFDTIIVDRVPYGKYDKYTTSEERKKTTTLTNRINYIHKLYNLPIITISITNPDSNLRINSFRKK